MFQEQFFSNIQYEIVFILAKNQKLVPKYRAYAVLQWYWKHTVNHLAETLQHHSFLFLRRDLKITYWGVCINKQYASYPTWWRYQSNPWWFWIIFRITFLLWLNGAHELWNLSKKDFGTLWQIARFNSVYVLILQGNYINIGWSP